MRHRINIAIDCNPPAAHKASSRETVQANPLAAPKAPEPEMVQAEAVPFDARSICADTAGCFSGASPPHPLTLAIQVAGEADQDFSKGKAQLKQDFFLGHTFMPLEQPQAGRHVPVWMGPM